MDKKTSTLNSIFLPAYSYPIKYITICKTKAVDRTVKTAGIHFTCNWNGEAFPFIPPGTNLGTRLAQRLV